MRRAGEREPVFSSGPCTTRSRTCVCSTSWPCWRPRITSASDSEQSALETTLAAGMQVSEFARRRYAALDGAGLKGFWHDRYRALAKQLALLGAEGAPAVVRTRHERAFVRHRALMETWAHGQDVFDALHRVRPATSRLQHIAHLGVLTFGWSFRNRGLEVPAVTPFVELTGPGGESWTWGERSETESVRGSAMDFCLVVTQRRHYLDTRLAVTGAVARGVDAPRPMLCRAAGARPRAGNVSGVNREAGGAEGAGTAADARSGAGHRRAPCLASSAARRAGAVRCHILQSAPVSRGARVSISARSLARDRRPHLRWRGDPDPPVRYRGGAARCTAEAARTEAWFYPLADEMLARMDPARIEAHALRDDADYLYAAAQFLDYEGAGLGPKRQAIARLLPRGGSR